MYADKRMTKYYEAMSISAKTAFTYRGNLFVNIFMRFIVVLFSLFLWRAIYMGTSVIGSYSLHEMIIYTFFANFIYGLVNFDDYSYEMANDILYGKISMYLLRPVSFIKTSFFECMGSKTIYFPVDLFAYVIPLVLFEISNGLEIFLNLYKFVAIIIFMAGGIIISFLIAFILGCLTFYIENPSIVIYIKGEVFALLSGSVLPLDIFPDWINLILEILPTKYMGYYQCWIFLKSWNELKIFTNFLMMIAWIFVLVITARGMWHKALSKYIANGG